MVYHIHAPHSPIEFSGAWLLCGALFSALGLLPAAIIGAITPTDPR